MTVTNIMLATNILLGATIILMSLVIMSLEETITKNNEAIQQNQQRIKELAAYDESFIKVLEKLVDVKEKDMSTLLEICTK